MFPWKRYYKMPIVIQINKTKYRIFTGSLPFELKYSNRHKKLFAYSLPEKGVVIFCENIRQKLTMGETNTFFKRNDVVSSNLDQDQECDSNEVYSSSLSSALYLISTFFITLFFKSWSPHINFIIQ
jgi:hypothetical protein